MAIEARDRLVRPVDFSTVFAQKHIHGILADTTNLAASRRPITTSVAETARGTGGNAAGRGSVGGVMRTNLLTARRNSARGRGPQRSPLTSGRENTPRMSGGRFGRGRGTHSVLPAWYPRTPLRDITAVVQAVERRRGRLREANGEETGIAQLEGHTEHDVSMISPNMTAEVTPRHRPVGKVSKLLLKVINQADGDLEFLTPQKKLLNSIDTVQKEVLEELWKLERTPSAKQAANEKRSRNLMSMR